MADDNLQPFEPGDINLGRVNESSSEEKRRWANDSVALLRVVFSARLNERTTKKNFLVAKNCKAAVPDTDGGGPASRLNSSLNSERER